MPSAAVAHSGGRGGCAGLAEKGDGIGGTIGHAKEIGSARFQRAASGIPAPDGHPKSPSCGHPKLPQAA